MEALWRRVWEFGVLGGVEVLMVVGFGLVGVVLAVFLVGEKYRRPSKRLSLVEHRWLRGEVEEQMARLAPAVISLGEKERKMAETLRGREVDGEARCWVEEVLAGLEESGFWRRFALVSGLAREDPEEAIEEIRRLRALLGAFLDRLEMVEKLLETRGEGNE
ncbi:MAG: hypothetical protein ACRDSJ_13525 [Rubrobacteraceae bacterium]